MHAAILLEYSVDFHEWHDTFAIPGAEVTRKFVRSVMVYNGVRMIVSNIGFATGPTTLELRPFLRAADLDTAPIG